MQKQNDTLPEDIFIDRYMPGATPEQRKEASENMRALIAVLLRINLRLAREECDSRESDSSDRFAVPGDTPAV